jgi:hypothetical protein
MFPIWKLFLHKEIQAYYQHIIFNIRKKIDHTWSAKVFTKTLQPLTFYFQQNSNLQNNVGVMVVPTTKGEITQWTPTTVVMFEKINEHLQYHDQHHQWC